MMNNNERAIGTRFAPFPGSGLLRHLWQYLVAANHARRTRAALDHLDDRLLKDIGLHRSEIGARAYRLARQDSWCDRDLR
ncbi:MAG: DUF1127 domain-containing protein [Rhodospirillaceae bacterium]|nr:DUF1127 domain-containing protein [Rhodospirillaceae bacterium]